MLLEQKVLIEYSKLTNRQVIDADLSTINMSLLYKYAVSNRVLPLVWSNLRHDTRLATYYDNIVRFVYMGYDEQNKLYFEELQRLMLKVREFDITIIPVKGAMLIPVLYKDNGLRYMSDIDILFSYDDYERVTELMHQLGYMQGTYNRKDNIINPIGRAKQLKWKMNMSNLYPFSRLTGNKWLPVIRIDYRFALDDTLSMTAVNEIISNTRTKDYVDKAHIFVHLCTHLFDESKQSMNIVIGQDLNLIKFVDVREYILNEMTNDDISNAIMFSKKHNLEKQLYYAVYHLKLIYGDGYEDGILNELLIHDNSFIHHFGESSLNDEYKWNKDFFSRLFSGDNRDELVKIPLYYEE